MVVTGGAKRLGKAMVQAVSAAGAKVAFTYLDSEAEATQVSAAIQAKGGEALAVRCDVRRPDSIANAIKTVSNKYGRIDVLINNAGFFETALFEELKPEQWDNMFAVNVRGPMLVSQQCVSARPALVPGR